MAFFERPFPRVPRSAWLSVVVIVAMLIFDAVVFGPAAKRNLGFDVEEPTSIETMYARVVRVLSDETFEEAGGRRIEQRVHVEITDGERKGQVVEVHHGEVYLAMEQLRVSEGDRVLLERTDGPAGERYLIADFVRLPSLRVLGAVFAVCIVAVGGWVGVRSLISMGFSVLVLSDFVLLGIVAGYNPLWVCIAGTTLLLVTSYYLVYGWNWKTHSAFFAFTICLVLTGFIATLFANWTRLTGMGAEEAATLTLFSSIRIDMRGLLLGGILIGASGVLDDITIGQASATFELKRANPALGWRELFQHGMVIGRDHVASMVNTLLLAYAGASLPLLVVMTMYAAPLGRTLNRDFIAEEIVRTLVGSLCLLLAVPITCLIASLLAQKHELDAEPTTAELPRS